jgi:hypothetical protein
MGKTHIIQKFLDKNGRHFDELLGKTAGGVRREDLCLSTVTPSGARRGAMRRG